MRKEEIAKMIDHGILSPIQNDDDLKKEIELAKRLQLGSVCIKPYAVKTAVDLLKDTGVKVGTVVGFPHGSNTVIVKVFETETAIKDGAVEIDMVVNIGKVRSGDYEYVENEISAIHEVCKKHNVLLKVIFENTYINKDDIKKLSKICTAVGADYIKTSTGFDYVKLQDGTITTKGAQLDDCILMRESAGNSVGIKAAGGIRDYDKTIALIEKGVGRIGTSASEMILKGGED